MARTAGHLSDDELAVFDDDEGGKQPVREHLAACQTCRGRRAELLRLRALLAHTGQREYSPLRDGVPSAMMRLRLRRYSVTNANELLGGFAALVRALAGLFSLPATDRRSQRRTRGTGEDQHD